MLKVVPRPNRAAISTELCECGATIKTEYGLFRIAALDCGALRFTFTRRGAFLDKPSPYVINRKTASAQRVIENEKSVLVYAGGLRAEASKENGIISVADDKGRILFSEAGLRTLEEFEAKKFQKGANAVTEEIETADGKKTVVSDAPKSLYKRLYRARLPIRFRGDEAIYGFGQQEDGGVNLRGRRLYLCQTNRSIAMPFFVSTGGYGLMIDCGCTLIFDDTGRDAYIYASAVEELDYYIIPGICERAVKGYHSLTGRPAPLPAWAFGYIQSQERYETQDEIISMAKSYREKGIGLDCAVMDWSSWPEGQWGQKTLDPVRFPNPDQMTKELHDMDVKFMISVWANPNRKTADHAKFKDKNLLLPGESLYDALDPEARRVYWAQASKGLYKHGVDAWWCDSSEPWTSEWSHKERPEPDATFYETDAIASNALGADNCNAYAFYHAQAIYEGQRGEDDKKRVVNLTRSGWLGQQRFGTILWSGDISASWETLRRQIAIGLNMSASGMPYWTQDIGGFFVKRGEAWYWDGEFENGWDDPEYRELFARWYQYAAFLPIFRGHGTDIRRELTNLCGAEYEAVMRYNKIRYRLLPYIYSLFSIAALRGGSVMKPLGFNYPSDETARNTDDEYLFGDDIIVCPVTEYKARSREVYLPEGEWYELETGKKICGGCHIEAYAPLDVLPLFVRAGAIIPVEGESVCSREALKQTPEFLVFPGADGGLEVYADAGDGYECEKGEYEIKTYAWNDEARRLTDENENVVPFRAFEKGMGGVKGA